MSQPEPPQPPPPPPPPDHQTYAIELYFDPALENQVLKAWNVLARRQITTHLISISSRPHITLLHLPTLALPDPLLRLQSALRSLAARADPVPLSLSTVGSSSSAASALFLLPTPTVSLLQLHAQLCEAVRREGVEVGEEYRVDTWLPCCAVAEDVPRGRMGEAFCVLRDMRLPVSGYAMDIGVVEVPAGGGAAVREVFSFTLGGSSLPEA